jgi:hypothetical protein
MVAIGCQSKLEESLNEISHVVLAAMVCAPDLKKFWGFKAPLGYEPLHFHHGHHRQCQPLSMAQGLSYTALDA